MTCTTRDKVVRQESIPFRFVGQTTKDQGQQSTCDIVQSAGILSEEVKALMPVLRHHLATRDRAATYSIQDSCALGREEQL